jgi:hypothetical protein
MNEPITISPRAAESVRQYLEQSQRLQDALRATVEALAAQLDVPQNWRFDTQSMTFVPPPKQAEIAGLSPEFVASHESVFCNATNREEVPPPTEPDPNE